MFRAALLATVCVSPERYRCDRHPPTQENAELLTEEGRLLQQIQGDDVIDYDIDAYATRLSEILDRKVCSYVFPCFAPDLLDEVKCVHSSELGRFSSCRARRASF